jgi:NADPH-dependent ferric siderophore reductase
VTAKAREYDATVARRERLSPHLVRLVLGDVKDTGGPDGFVSTGIPDEWVGLVVPGQFQSRYYTVRSWDGAEMVLDVVLHDEGLVTEWALRDCTGERVTLTEPKGSFAMPATATWLMLVGDLTAMPAMARILDLSLVEPASASERRRDPLTVKVFAEVADDLPGYLPDGADVTWLAPPGSGASGLASVVETIEWPEGEGYFWMAGESSQMRAIRKHLMREVRLPSTAYDVMGYWRGGALRQPRAVDPGPIWRAGKAAGKSDEEIWAAYDAEAGSAPLTPPNQPEEREVSR